jgi:hypothetical protein
MASTAGGDDAMTTPEPPPHRAARRRPVHRDGYDASPSRMLVLFGTEFRRLQLKYPELATRIETGLRGVARAA